MIIHRLRNSVFLRFSEANNLDTAEELLEEAYNAFDDLWKLNKFNFPEENMKNLFDIIGTLTIGLKNVDEN